MFNWLRRKKREDAASVEITGTAPSASVPSAPRLGVTPIFRPGYYGPADALTVGTVYRCVDILSGMVAALPLRCLRRDKRGLYTETRDEQMNYLLRVQPNDDTSAFVFWRGVMIELLLRGNAYVYPEYRSGKLVRLVLLAHGKVSHDTAANRYVVNDYDNGVFGVFRPDEILHFVGLSLDGRRGVSVLAYAATTMGIAITGNVETLHRFQSGGNVRGIVSNDSSIRGFGEYQDEELNKTAEDLDFRFRAGERIVSLPGQVQFEHLSLSSVDMEFLATRKWTGIDICRFFGVPPSYVFAETASNYKSAELENVALLSTTLNPILTNIEGELLRKLILKPFALNYLFEFDRRRLHACDLAGMARYQEATIRTGIYTINDWRRRENQPPVAGGDEPLVSANLKSLGELIAGGGTTKNQGDEQGEE